MPKNPPEKEKINDLKNFVNLTWELIRRNLDYRKDYLKFLQIYGLSHEDVKGKVNHDGCRIISVYPCALCVSGVKN
jgi:hypothetical protein